MSKVINVNRNFATFKAHVQPSTVLLEVLRDACRFFHIEFTGDNDIRKYSLVSNQKALDLSLPYRFCNLAQGANLDLIGPTDFKDISDMDTHDNSSTYFNDDNEKKSNSTTDGQKKNDKDLVNIRASISQPGSNTLTFTEKISNSVTILQFLDLLGNKSSINELKEGSEFFEVQTMMKILSKDDLQKSLFDLGVMSGNHAFRIRIKDRTLISQKKFKDGYRNGNENDTEHHNANVTNTLNKGKEESPKVKLNVDKNKGLPGELEKTIPEIIKIPNTAEPRITNTDTISAFGESDNNTFNENIIINEEKRALEGPDVLCTHLTGDHKQQLSSPAKIQVILHQTTEKGNVSGRSKTTHAPALQQAPTDQENEDDEDTGLYEMNASQAKLYQKILSQRAADTPLLTKNLREKFENRRKNEQLSRIYDSGESLIRIKFPDGSLIQITIDNRKKLRDIYKIINANVLKKELTESVTTDDDKNFIFDLYFSHPLTNILRNKTDFEKTIREREFGYNRISLLFRLKEELAPLWNAEDGYLSTDIIKLESSRDTLQHKKGESSHLLDGGFGGSSESETLKKSGNTSSVTKFKSAPTWLKLHR